MCLVFALIVLFLVFFNTYIFQAGLVYLLVRKFRTTIIVTVFYLALSVGLHVWTVVSTGISSLANSKHVILYVYDRIKIFAKCTILKMFIFLFNFWIVGHFHAI